MKEVSGLPRFPSAFQTCLVFPMHSFLCFLYSLLSPGPLKPTTSLAISLLLYVSKANSSYRYTSATYTSCCCNNPIFQIQCWPKQPQILKAGASSVCSVLINFPRCLLLAIVRDRIQAQVHLCRLTHDGWLSVMQLFTSNPTVKFLCYLSISRSLFLSENITLK